MKIVSLPMLRRRATAASTSSNDGRDEESPYPDTTPPPIIHGSDDDSYLASLPPDHVLRRGKDRTMSVVIADALANNRADFDGAGVDFEHMSAGFLDEIVEQIKSDYDQNKDGRIDEEELKNIIIASFRMGLNNQGLKEENSALYKKVRRVYVGIGCGYAMYRSSSLH